MSTKKIHLGFELGTGSPVDIPPSHIIVTGLTQLSGKTTTLEALITRSELKAVVFKTKPGEREFNSGNPIAPYFKEKSDWQYVSSLLEATLKEKLKFERSWIMDACKGTSSLLQVKRNIEAKLANPKLGGLNRSVYTTLDEYLNLIIPQISVTTFSNVLELQRGINVMELNRLSDELQGLVIRSVLETVLKETHDTIIVIPEAWKFLPQGRGNPCKQAAEDFIRQGATNRNYLWIDSQEIAGVDKTPLKQVSTWILGLQSELNEVKHTLQQMPVAKQLRPKEDQIMTLQKGHFFVCTPTLSKKVYVQPVWLDPETAIAIATGEKKVEGVVKPLAALMPALPQFSKPEKDQNLLTLEEVKKSIVEVRNDFENRFTELTSYIGRVAETVRAFSATPQTAAKMNTDEIVASVIQKIPNAEMLTQKITDAVMKRLPAGGGTGIIVIEPLKALQKQFLEEAKQNLLKALNDLPDKQKRIIKFLESMQKGITQKDLLEKCLGMEGKSGGNQKTIRIMTQELHAGGFVKRDDRIAMTYPNLQKKISEELGFRQATEEEIQQVYNHIIAEVL